MQIPAAERIRQYSQEMSEIANTLEKFLNLERQARSSSDDVKSGIVALLQQAERASHRFYSSSAEFLKDRTVITVGQNGAKRGITVGAYFSTVYVTHDITLPY